MSDWIDASSVSRPGSTKWSRSSTPSPAISTTRSRKSRPCLPSEASRLLPVSRYARVGLARELPARDVALRRDVAPVFAAGILHEEVHVAHARERGEELEQQRAAAPARRRSRRVRGSRRSLIGEASARRSCACNAARCCAPASCASRCHSAACQCSRVARAPTRDPVGAIDEIFVEQRGEPRRELEAAQCIAADVGIARARTAADARAPAADRGCATSSTSGSHADCSGSVTADRAIQLPRESGREREAHVRAHPCAIGEPERKPARDAAALDHDHFARERGRERLARDARRARRRALRGGCSGESSASRRERLPACGGRECRRSRACVR